MNSCRGLAAAGFADGGSVEGAHALRCLNPQAKAQESGRNCRRTGSPCDLSWPTLVGRDFHAQVAHAVSAAELQPAPQKLQKQGGFVLVIYYLFVFYLFIFMWLFIYLFIC